MLSAQNVAKFEGYMQGFSALAKLLPPGAAKQAAPAFGAFAGLLGVMQQNVGIFSQVPAGLTHYKPLVTTMQANVDNFKQVNSLPDFRLFTWFFVVPGVLLVLLAGVGLFGRPLTVRAPFHHPGARPTPA
jgi:hypothetical protein